MLRILGRQCIVMNEGIVYMIVRQTFYMQDPPLEREIEKYPCIDW